MSRLTSVLASLMLAAVPAVAQAKSAKLPAPKITGPADGATVEDFPAFTWNAVRHADRYQVQIAADSRFTSPVGIFNGDTGLFTTASTAATTSKSASDGSYYWRVRALRPSGGAGAWSGTRKLTKAWTTPPTLQGADGLSVSWPGQPLLLRWSAVPHAVKYQLSIATDAGMSNVIIGGTSNPVEVFGNLFALPRTLAAGQYYWNVVPVDAEGFKGQPSAVGHFDWSWPTGTTIMVGDLNGRVYDPQFSWTPVPGAARYEVEVNATQDFAPNSKWCCDDKTVGTSLSPQRVLANNSYYLRVRALDVDGNAGAWNVYNGTFTKAFDNVAPTIPGLRLTDPTGSALSAGASTASPVVRWDAVPGAQQYEVQSVPFVDGFGCSYTNPDIMRTATLAWTPLGQTGANVYPDLSPQTDGSDPAPGSKWCLRVRALSDEDAQGHQVRSDWTNLGDNSTPAFIYATPSDPGSTLGTAAAGDYLTPSDASSNVRTPLFTWKPIAGARSYIVVVSRDPDFTNLADTGLTQIPAYAPRLRAGGLPVAEPLTDETTNYYWAVIPAAGSDGTGTFSTPDQNAPRTFNKNSIAPTPLGPSSGSDIATQPTFHWTEAEGARNYRLQVATDPTFSRTLDDVVTDSTAFTSLSTYPADTTLYWRVRGNDANGNGLNWSSVGTFTRRLPVPNFLPATATSGSGLPLLAWAPVDGAVAYDIHSDNGDGSTSDFTSRSTIDAPTEIWGTGVLHYKVRAVFPSSSGGDVRGPYTELQPFTRTFGPVTGVNALRSTSRVILSWNDYTGAKSYHADISTTDSFDHVIASVQTDENVWAPDLQNSPGGRLYYRVTPMDTHGSNGAEATGNFTLPRAMRINLTGLVLRNVGSRITIKVTDSAGRVVRNASVTITGAGMRTRRTRLNRRGRVAITLHARRPGKVTIFVHKKGYVDGSTTTNVL